MLRKARLNVGGILAVALVLLVAGCGGSGTSSNTHPQSASVPSAQGALSSPEQKPTTQEATIPAAQAELAKRQREAYIEASKKIANQVETR